MDLSAIPDKTLELLRLTKVIVSPETFHVLRLSDDEWRGLLQNPEASPSMDVPFYVFKDDWEITLVVCDADLKRIEGALEKPRAEKNFRLMSFDAPLEFDVVGYLAAITTILAASGISILALTSFARDHLLVRQSDLSKALKAFSGHVLEMC